MDRVSLRELITSALPTARGLTGDFWDAYVQHDQELLYPLELFTAIAFQCHGLSRYEHIVLLYECTIAEDHMNSLTILFFSSLSSVFLVLIPACATETRPPSASTCSTLKGGRRPRTTRWRSAYLRWSEPCRRYVAN